MANGLPYYKAYPRDFIEGTIGMPFEIKCAYRVIIDLIYMQGGKLPDDARYISGLLGCSLRKWSSLRDALILADKIQVSGEFISNYRADKEIETLAKLQDNQRQNASGCRKIKGLQKPPHSQPEPEPYKIDGPYGPLSPGGDFCAPQVDDFLEAVGEYNLAAKAAGWPVVKVLSKSRRSALTARLRECGGMDGWRDVITKARASPHCCGQNERGWTANFDFLIRQPTFAKLIEGNYDKRQDRQHKSLDAALRQISYRKREPPPDDPAPVSVEERRAISARVMRDVGLGLKMEKKNEK